MKLVVAIYMVGTIAPVCLRFGQTTRFGQLDDFRRYGIVLDRCDCPLLFVFPYSHTETREMREEVSAT